MFHVEFSQKRSPKIREKRESATGGWKKLSTIWRKDGEDLEGRGGPGR